MPAHLTMMQWNLHGMIIAIIIIMGVRITLIRAITQTIIMKVKLMARKGMNIREALSNMVDLPLDIIFTELGRFPWKLKKFRIVLSAEEIAKLAGVELAGEQEEDAG